MNPMTAITKTLKSNTRRAAFAAAAVMGVLALQTSQASAVSSAVKMACMGDYLANCSKHQVGSAQLRQCMRAVGAGLSKRCINALVAAGEVSKSEVSRKSAQLRD